MNPVLPLTLDRSLFGLAHETWNVASPEVHAKIATKLTARTTTDEAGSLVIDQILVDLFPHLYSEGL